MPSENKTPNLGLNQWAGNEYPKRTDFNEDNFKIDEKVEGIERSIEGLQRSVENIEVPVTSVNGKTGAVKLTTSDVGAAPSSHMHVKSEVGLSNVQNYAIASTAEAQAGTVNNKYMTPALVKAAVQYLAHTGGISMVKSVQRGNVTPTSNSTTVNISAINASKALVILDGNYSYTSVSDSESSYAPRLISLSNTSLVIGKSGLGNSYSAVSWQVIEFY